ncbi:MAG: FG-GAP-like repeat-containing protein [Polyangia bacterium]
MTTLKKFMTVGGAFLMMAGDPQNDSGCGGGGCGSVPSDPPATAQLTVSSDNSLGRVTSDPAGIDCGTTCSTAVPPGASVTLTAAPLGGTNATFLGWSGPCSGTQPTCTLTVNESTTVTANWMRPTPPDMAMPADLAQLPAPSITSVAPPSAANNVATNITLTGTNFRSGATVSVGGQACGNPTVVSATQITCTVPAKAATCGPQSVVVTNPDAQTATKTAYTYMAASVAFATPVALSGTLNGPHRMIVADFNNDGYPDLAHSNQAPAGFVSVYLGSKTGAFGGAKNANVGSSPIGLAAGDLNKDGNQDLVVANSGDGNLSYLAGDGKGGFASVVNISVGIFGIEGVAIADIDGDTNPDVAVVYPLMNQVVLYKGDGKGGLTVQATKVSVGGNARYLALADVNGDKFPDLLVPNQGSNTVSYRPNKADGTVTFAAGMDIAAGTDPYEVVVADVNSDQKPDFLFTSSGGNSVGVFLGDGKGAWSAATGSPFAAGSSPVFLGVSDFNGDGKPDFVVANQSSSSLSLLIGNGTGGFTKVPASPFAGGNGPTGVGVADFNGDGLIDFANTNFFGGTATVRFGTCN